jgi:hypothetical protein
MAWTLSNERLTDCQELARWAGGMNVSMCSSLLGVLNVFFSVLVLAVGFCDNEVPIDGENWRLCGIPLPHPSGIASWTSSLATVGEDLDG